jgi:hypothetical protein
VDRLFSELTVKKAEFKIKTNSSRNSAELTKSKRSDASIDDIYIPHLF